MSLKLKRGEILFPERFCSASKVRLQTSWESSLLVRFRIFLRIRYSSVFLPSLYFLLRTKGSWTLEKVDLDSLGRFGLLSPCSHSLCDCGLASVSSSLSREDVVRIPYSPCVFMKCSLFSLWTLVICYQKWEISNHRMGGKNL